MTEKKNRGIKTRKNDVKLWLFTDDIIIWLKNPGESNDKNYYK